MRVQQMFQQMFREAGWTQVHMPRISAVAGMKRVLLQALVLCCWCCAWGVLGRGVWGIVTWGELMSSSDSSFGLQGHTCVG